MPGREEHVDPSAFTFSVSIALRILLKEKGDLKLRIRLLKMTLEIMCSLYLPEDHLRGLPRRPTHLL